jgi:hypothetical protein
MGAGNESSLKRKVLPGGLAVASLDGVYDIAPQEFSCTEDSDDGDTVKTMQSV